MRCSLTPWFLLTLLALPLAARTDDDRWDRNHRHARSEERDHRRGGWRHREAERLRWEQQRLERQRWERERLARERWERRRDMERWERARWSHRHEGGRPMAFIPGDPWHAYVLVNGGWALRRLDRPCHEYRTRRFEGRIQVPLPRVGLSLTWVLD